MTPLAVVNHLQSQEDEVSNWEPAHSLVTDSVSGAEITAALCLLSLTVAGLPLCLWGGRALSSWLALLWYSLNPLFFGCTRGHCVAIEPFEGKVFFCLFVCFSVEPMVLVAISHYLPQLVLTAFRLGPYPKD